MEIMNEQPAREQDALDRLSDLLVDDILSTSDEELLTEITDEGIDPDQLASEMSALFEEIVHLANGRQLAPVQPAIGPAPMPGKVIEFPIKQQPVVSFTRRRRSWLGTIPALSMSDIFAYMQPAHLTAVGFDFSVVGAVIFASLIAWQYISDSEKNAKANSPFKTEHHSQLLEAAPNSIATGSLNASSEFAAGPTNVIGRDTVASAMAWIASHPALGGSRSNSVPEHRPEDSSVIEPRGDATTSNKFPAAVKKLMAELRASELPASRGRSSQALLMCGSVPQSADTCALYEDRIARGENSFAQGDFVGALRSYDEAISLNHSSAVAFNNRGDVYFVQRRYDAALEDYTEAIERAPDSAVAYTNRGDAFFAKREFARAISDFTKAFVLDSERAIALNNRGRAFLKTGDYSKALSDLTNSIRHDPRQAITFANLGDLHLALSYRDDKHSARELRLALAAYNKAVLLEPTEPAWLKDRATVYSLTGRNNLAEADLDEFAQTYLIHGTAVSAANDPRVASSGGGVIQRWSIDPASTGFGEVLRGESKDLIGSWKALGRNGKNTSE
jgi:tetratricopeptide (TPR) repeat protein